MSTKKVDMNTVKISLSRIIYQVYLKQRKFTDVKLHGYFDSRIFLPDLLYDAKHALMPDGCEE